MGYEYQQRESGSGGQRGVCIFNDAQQCDAWAFLTGKCGQSFSFCAQQGYDVRTVNDGQNAFSPEYAVCISKYDRHSVGAMTELFSLSEKIQGAGCASEPEGLDDSLISQEGEQPYEREVTAQPLSLPSSFDWRNYAGGNWDTPVKNQSMCGSCWAFGAVSIVEASYNIAYRNPNLDLDLSEQYLVSDCLPGHTCCGGDSSQALYYIRNNGVPDENCMPYVDGDRDGCACWQHACSSVCTYNSSNSCSDRICSDRCADYANRLKYIDAYGRVPNSPSTIKQALVDKGPLAASMGMSDDDIGGYWDGNIYRCTNDLKTTHVVAIVGYNDAGGYWIVKNSWGVSWHTQGGYFHVGYGECAIENYVHYAEVALPVPPAPGLQSPPDRAAYRTNRLTFSWNTVSDGASYEFEIDDDRGFRSPEYHATVATTTLTAPSLPDSTYYWRVRALNLDAEPGPWSAAWQVTIDTAPPDTPRLNVPRDRTNVTSTTPRFTWAAVRGADRYHLQVSTTPNFSSLKVNDATLTRPNHTVPAATPLTYGTYYWRVRAHDVADNWSGWSVGNTFTITLLKTPKNGDFTKDTTPTFRWAGVRGAARYWLQVSTTSNFSTLLVNENDLTRGAFTPAGALPFGPLYWRVQVDMGGGYTDEWTPAWTFTVTPSVPVKPALQSPANRTITHATPDALTWQPLDDGATYRYQVQIDDQANFRSPLQDVTLDSNVTTYIPAPLSENGRVFWRVRAINEYGMAGQWSATWWFRLDAPPRPTLIAPANRSTTASSGPTFEWAVVPDAAEYQIQISRDRKFGTVDQAAAVTNATYPSGALPDGIYFWRVRGVHNAGIAGQWSAVWQITVDSDGPDAPVLSVPKQGSATPDTTPRLAWKASRGAVEYRVQVDVSPSFNTGALQTWDGLTRPVHVVLDGDALSYRVYHWRVRARDERNVWGAWSQTGTFTVTVHKSPQDGSATINDRPTFRWAAVSGAQYRVQIDNDSAFSNPRLVDQSIATNSYQPPAGLLSYGTFYWRVSIDGGASWMPAWSVTITPTPPARVKLSTPVNRTLTNDSTPTLMWKAALRGEVYQVQIDDDRKFGSPAQDVTLGAGTLIYTANTLPDGIYYWRVRALNTLGAPGPWSAIWRLDVDTIAPETPALVAPEHGARVTNAKLKLEWAPIGDAARYEVQIDPVPSFPLPPIDAARRTTYRLPTTLAQNVYHWRVRAVDMAGNASAWSAVRSFSLVAGNTALTEPTSVPTETPLPTLELAETPLPTGTPLPTEPPTATPLPTELPTDTPAPTVAPTSIPLPTATLVPTVAPTELPEQIIEPPGETRPTEDVTSEVMPPNAAQ